MVVMPDDDPASDAPREGHKLFKKYSWREKLSRREEKGNARAADNVNDFLGQSNKAVPSLSEPGPRSSLPTAPRIDVSVSPRWPSSHDLAKSPGLVGNLDVPQQQQRGRWESSSRRKPRRQGLNVQFAQIPPEIIGEGGDESDIPTREISIARARSHSPYLESFRSSRSPSTAVTPPGIQNACGAKHDGSRPRVLVRQPTGFHEERSTSALPPTLALTAHQADYDLSMRAGTSDSQVIIDENVEPDSSAGRTEASMRTEEGVAQQTSLRNISNESPFERTSTAHISREGFSPAVLSENGSTHAQLDMPAYGAPQPSSAAATHDDGGQSMQPVAPLPIPLREYTRDVSPVRNADEDTQTMRPVGTRAKSPIRKTVSHDGDRGRNISRSDGKTFRAVAHAVSDDAMADFASRVDNLDSIFALALEGLEPVKERPLSEWIRVSTWWFIQGRAGIEDSIRAQERGALEAGDEHRFSPKHPQAHVDLAKAWWINQHIVPQHPELRRYGSLGMSTLLAAVQDVGDRAVASLIEIHQALLSHLRALAISMKHKDLLPPLEGVSLSQGIDTSIWIKYPRFAEDVTSVLSGANANFLRARGTNLLVNIGQLMPLGDGPDHFCYGRMFVDIRISLTDHELSGFALPCMLSIVRGKSVLGVKVAIVSQTELVDIIIQGDEKQGMSWKQVDWQLKSHVMRLKLSKDMQVTVHFKEYDFKTLWHIVEYTRRIEESGQPMPGESLVFEHVLKVFHYIDPGTPKAFPPEPSRYCCVRVFERTMMITEGTGKRSAHRGFRIQFVTSSSIKTLSSISHILGNGRPIVFSYLRGDGDAPALLLTVDEEKRLRKLVLTFHEASERTDLHSRLIGVALAQDEKETAPITLQSFCLSTVAPSSPKKAFTAFEGFKWEAVRAINIDTSIINDEYGPTVLSENLRLCIESSVGTVTDRVNLGIAILSFCLCSRRC